MKYKITLKGKTYEVEVEKGEAMILDEYEAKSPIPPARQHLRHQGEGGRRGEGRRRAHRH